MSLLALVLLLRDITYTYDSYNFLCGALSFKEKGRILMCDNSYMTLSPPGFSVFLSFFLSEAKAISGIYKISTIIVYGLTLICWINIVKRELKDYKFIVFAFLLIAVALPLFYVHLFLWSEGIFLLLFSFGVLSLSNFKENLLLKWLLLAILSFCLSVTVRYAGIVLYILYFTGWIYAQKIKFRREQIFILCLPLIVTASFIAVNYFLDNFFFGERPFLNRHFLEILNASLKVICNWMVPIDGITVWFRLLILISGLLLLSCYNKNNLPWLLTLVGYFFFIVYSAYMTDIEYDERLFAPVYPIFIICVFKSLSQLPKTKFTNWGVLLFLILWTLYSSFRSGKNILMWLN